MPLPAMSRARTRAAAICPGCLQRQRGGYLRAIQEREPFLGLQDQRLDSQFTQRLRRRHSRAFQGDLAFADQGRGKVRQRRQIARSANRALPGQDRQCIGIQQRGQSLDDFSADP